MKFYLAIAFALLMATAYGFRVNKETTTTELTCESDDWTYDYGVICDGSSEWCNTANGGHNNTYTTECEDGMYYKSECDDIHTSTNSKFECKSTDCQGGEDTSCSLCKEVYNSTYNEEHSNSTSHMESYCENADGTQWSKLAYLI
jgi:hypothetical protein